MIVLLPDRFLWYPRLSTIFKRLQNINDELKGMNFLNDEFPIC